MGLQPVFLLLHPPLFEVEAQRQEKQLDTYVPFTCCHKSTEAKIVFQ